MPVLYGPFQSVLKDKNGEQLFYPRVKTVDDVSAAQASLTVRFLPCSTRHLDGTMATRSLVTGARCVRFDRADTSASGEGEGGKPEGGGSGGVTPDPSV